MKNFRLLSILLLLSLLCESCSLIFYDLQTANYKGYLRDTVRYEINYGHIILETICEEDTLRLVMDTGADMTRIPKTKKHRTLFKNNVIDALGNSRKLGVTHVKSMRISNSEYLDFYSHLGSQTGLFSCYSDGALGNNTLEIVNYKILPNNKLIISKQALASRDTIIEMEFYFYNSNSLHTNLSINEIPLDTVLLDSGGSFSVQLPFHTFDMLKETLEVKDTLATVRSDNYGIFESSSFDTTYYYNCNFTLNGYGLDDILISTSKSYHEPRIGYGFLKRFNEVVINYDKNEILLGNLIPNSGSSFDNYFKYAFDISDSLFEVSFNQLSELNPLQHGDKVKSVNGYTPLDFENSCDFNQRYGAIFGTDTLQIVTLDNEIINVINRR